MSRHGQQVLSSATPKQAGPIEISEFRSNGSQDASNPYQLESIFTNEIVRYKCSCGQLRTLYSTYFCRHCMTLRCRSCVAQEVDSQYCQHCLEYIPTIDPKFQLNKCASCYQCPSCHHLLSTSVQSTSPSSSDLATQKEETLISTCQLVCEFCRWASRSFISDSTRALNTIGDIEIESTPRIRDLISFYKATSQKERADKKKRRYHSRGGNTMDLLRKYGIDNTLSPKLFESLRTRHNFRERSSPVSKQQQEPAEDAAIESFKPAEALESDELEKLDTDFYYGSSFSPESISQLSQRLIQVEIQPEKTANFRPVSKSLSVKRSLRCKECERNLCRSEYSPVSIRFKIQSASYYHIPELRLRSSTYPIKLDYENSNIIEFTLQNQTLTSVKVRLDLVADHNSDLYELSLPKYELNLGPRDETVDLDHVPVGIRPLNEETQVTYQSYSRLGFFVKVKLKEKVEALELVFSMTHDIVLPQNPRENDRTECITQIVHVSLGSTEIKEG